MRKVILFLGVGFMFPLMMISVNVKGQKTVTIGKQIWMTENLTVDKFRNGDSIPKAKTDKEWANAKNNKQPAWCYYDNDSANGAIYGKLYNWYAVNDIRGLAPKGYHVPSDSDWTQLSDLLGKNLAAIKMKSKSGWKKDHNGTNESGFSALPGGYRGLFDNSLYIGSIGQWWSSTENTILGAETRFLYYNNGYLIKKNEFKGAGFSVRCLLD
jgi:uncharacterized protein (TIGR02145 family)